MTRSTPLTGPYFTPAPGGGLRLSIAVHAAYGAVDAGLELSDGVRTGLRRPSASVRSPVWSEVIVHRFDLGVEPWRTHRLFGDGWEIPPAAVPPAAPSGRFLILSDLQNLPLVPGVIAAARMEHGHRPFDAVLFPGDLVDVAERMEDWTGHPQGRGFFDLLSPTDGSGILATSRFLPCPGNHDISAVTGEAPEDRFNNVSPNDWSLRVYSHLFGLPDAYSVRLGDVWIGSLLVTRCYEKGDHEKREGRAYEMPGRFIYEPIACGSRQYEWLARELASEACRTARVRIILMHHGAFTQGHSAILPFGTPTAYAEDFLVRDLHPLLRWGGVHLVFNGHNHVVNHHVVDGIHYVESSHIGTTYGAYRRLPSGEPAAEPNGHPSRIFVSEKGARFYSYLETEGAGRIVTSRVGGGDGGEVRGAAGLEGGAEVETIDEAELGFCVTRPHDDPHDDPR